MSSKLSSLKPVNGHHLACSTLDPVENLERHFTYHPTNSKNSNKSPFSENESSVFGPPSLFPVKTFGKGNHSSQDNQVLSSWGGYFDTFHFTMEICSA